MEEAEGLRSRLGAHISQADGTLLHQEMQRRSHLEARQVIWEADAKVLAHAFIKNAKQWYDRHTDWKPTYVLPIEADPHSAPLVWPPNRGPPVHDLDAATGGAPCGEAEGEGARRALGSGADGGAAATAFGST